MAFFDRTTSPMSLTWEGSCFVEKAKLISALEDELLSELTSVSRSVHGKLVFGITPEFAGSLLPRILPVFRRAFPNVQMDIVTDNNDGLMGRLERGKIELAIITPVEQRPAYLYETVMEEEAYQRSGGLTLAVSASQVQPLLGVYPKSALAGSGADD